MTVVTDATYDWSSAVTLATAEFWQVQEGPMFIATSASAAPSGPTDGLLLSDGDILALGATEVVRYRSARPDGKAVFVRRSKE
jgi:hypothetical protein